MTPKQEQRIRDKIKKIRATLTSEKRRFGCYDDSRGLRYLPLGLYLKLQDYKGGLVYSRWFTRNFPDDIGFPDFLFEWAVILFMNHKHHDAEKKILECYFSNTYILDKFFDKPSVPIDKAEYSNIDIPEFTQYFTYSYKLSELRSFSEWLSDFIQTEKFISISKRFIDSRIKLKNENDLETRRYLSRIRHELLEEI